MISRYMTCEIYIQYMYICFGGWTPGLPTFSYEVNVLATKFRGWSLTTLYEPPPGRVEVWGFNRRV